MKRNSPPENAPASSWPRRRTPLQGHAADRHPTHRHEAPRQAAAGEEAGKATALKGLGKALVTLGEFPPAVAALQEALDLWQRLGQREREAPPTSATHPVNLANKEGYEVGGTSGAPP
jgi:hypothetical protein